jgi:hypothetical protein
MSNNDLEEEIDHLAAKVEQKIKEGRSFIDGLPDFTPRSRRSRKMRQTIKNNGR